MGQTVATGCHEDGGVHKEVNDVQHCGVLSVSNAWVLYILHKSHVLQRYVFYFCDTWRCLVESIPSRKAVGYYDTNGKLCKRAPPIIQRSRVSENFRITTGVK